MQEKWKDIKGYEGLYQISNLGNVKSLKRNRFNYRLQRMIVVNKEKLFGNERYNSKSTGRPSVSDMAKDIGEKSSADGSLTLYKLYQILSERCHNAYFSSLLDDVNKVHSSIPACGLDEGQIREVLIMAAIVLSEYNYDVK